MEKLRICSKGAAVASAVLLCGSMALAQTGTSPSGQTNGGSNGSMNGTNGTNGTMNRNGMGGMDGANGMGANGTTGQSSMSDKSFVRTAMEGSLAEVQLGKLALQKSNNDQVKQFAQRMIDDHTKLNEQMTPVAQQVGVTVPTHPSKKDEATMAKLQALSGTDFDKAYIKDMVKDHTKDEKEFQQEASNGKDPAVKDAASQGATVIAQHLQMAQQMAKDQNVSISGGGQ